MTARINRKTLAYAAIVLAMLVLPRFLSAYSINVLNDVGLYAVLALSLNIILGHAGLFNMGHAAFYAMGAAYISIAWKDAIAFLVLICILIFRPTGILGEKSADKI